MTLRHSCTDSVRKRPKAPTPALLTSTSRPAEAVDRRLDQLLHRRQVGDVAGMDERALGREPAGDLVQLLRAADRRGPRSPPRPRTAPPSPRRCPSPRPSRSPSCRRTDPPCATLPSLFSPRVDATSGGHAPDLRRSRRPLLRRPTPAPDPRRDGAPGTRRLPRAARGRTPERVSARRQRAAGLGHRLHRLGGSGGGDGRQGGRVRRRPLHAAGQGPGRPGPVRGARPRGRAACPLYLETAAPKGSTVRLRPEAAQPGRARPPVAPRPRRRAPR